MSYVIIDVVNLFNFITLVPANISAIPSAFCFIYMCTYTETTRNINAVALYAIETRKIFFFEKKITQIMLEHIIKMKSEVIFHTFFRMELYFKRV